LGKDGFKAHAKDFAGKGGGKDRASSRRSAHVHKKGKARSRKGGRISTFELERTAPSIDQSGKKLDSIQKHEEIEESMTQEHVAKKRGGKKRKRRRDTKCQ